MAVLCCIFIWINSRIILRMTLAPTAQVWTRFVRLLQYFLFYFIFLVFIPLKLRLRSPQEVLKLSAMMRLPHFIWSEAESKENWQLIWTIILGYDHMHVVILNTYNYRNEKTVYSLFRILEHWINILSLDHQQVSFVYVLGILWLFLCKSYVFCVKVSSGTAVLSGWSK